MIPSPVQLFNFFFFRYGHVAKDCENEAPGNRATVCYRCGKSGHRARECTNEDGPLCYNCQKCGHIAADCPEA